MASEKLNKKDLPLVAIVGPTASGKSAAAMEIAGVLGGEIICADSRTVYKGMDVGTAKPTKKDRELIEHHLIDVCEPSKVFTAAEFKRLTEATIKDIRGRSKIPILVGGSGLYVDSVLFNYQFKNIPDQKLRSELELLSIEELQNYCHQHGIEMPENHLNKRYLIRAIEQNGINKQRQSSQIDNSFVVGITIDKSELKARITARASQMLEQGVADEARKLGAIYGWDIEPMKKGIYAIMRRFINNEISQDDALSLIIKSDMALAKKQMTWFKRNKNINWVDSQSTAVQLIIKSLN